MRMIGSGRVLVLAAVALLFGVGSGRAEQDFDKKSYYRAVDYCRGDVVRPLALSQDGQILCFDGDIAHDLNILPARGLKAGGLFVVRGARGNSDIAMAISNFLLHRRATVVVYDYCLSTCAMFFLIASNQTYVLKGALVAWSYFESPGVDIPFCTFVTEPDRGQPEKLQRGPCWSGGQRSARLWPELARFFWERTADPWLDPPPDSVFVRRILKNYYAETGVFHNIAWTLNPRYYPKLFKTKIVYEAYPQSQEEVDGMAARIRAGKVIYDP